MTTCAPRIELRYFNGCPNVERVRALIRSCLERLHLDAPIEEHEGDFHSPTLLIDGVDVTGLPAGTERVCRLDLPTEAQVMAALRRSAAARQ